MFSHLPLDAFGVLTRTPLQEGTHESREMGSDDRSRAPAAVVPTAGGDRVTARPGPVGDYRDGREETEGVRILMTVSRFRVRVRGRGTPDGVSLQGPPPLEKRRRAGSIPLQITRLYALALALSLASCQSPEGGMGGSMASADSSAKDGPLNWTSMYVDGLSCPLCSHNVTLQLARIDGVRDVQVNLGTGEVRVGFEAGSCPSAEALAKAVHDAGFTLAPAGERP